MLTQNADLPEKIDLYEIFTPVVRDFRITDMNFIKKTWLRSYQEGRYVGRDRYYRKQKTLIEQILSTDNTRVAIVCDEASPDFIVGFVVIDKAPGDKTRPIVLHYAYTKQEYRLQGFFKMMLRALGWYEGRRLLCTHWTNLMHDCKRHFTLEHDEWILKGIVNPVEL